MDSDDSRSPAARFSKPASRRERHSGPIEIDFPGSRKLKVIGQVDAAVVAQIVTALAELSISMRPSAI